jgi:hypothetical protein
MQQGYPSYPYYNPSAYQPPYGQPAPPPQQQHNPYAPYYAPPNTSQGPQGPQPYTFDAAAYTQRPDAQSRRQRKHHSFTAAPPAPPAPAPAPALKSAMKKTMNIFQTADTSMGRQLSYPGQTENRPQIRQRTHSNPAKPLQRRESVHDHDQVDTRNLSGDPVTCKTNILLIAFALTDKIISPYDGGFP